MKALQQGIDTLLSKKHKKGHKKSGNKKTKKEYISESSSESTESDKDSSDKSDKDNSDTESQKSVSKIDEHILQNLYNSISKYNGEGDIQKLYDFIDKVESYLNMIRLDTNIELDIVTVSVPIEMRSRVFEVGLALGTVELHKF